MRICLKTLKSQICRPSSNLKAKRPMNGTELKTQNNSKERIRRECYSSTPNSRNQDATSKFIWKNSLRPWITSLFQFSVITRSSFTNSCWSMRLISSTKLASTKEFNLFLKPWSSSYWCSPWFWSPTSFRSFTFYSFSSTWLVEVKRGSSFLWPSSYLSPFLRNTSCMLWTWLIIRRLCPTLRRFQIIQAQLLAKLSTYSHFSSDTMCSMIWEWRI